MRKSRDKEIAELDERLKEAGMIPLSKILNEGSPTDQFMVHAGVKDLETFRQWLDMRHTEMMKMKARMLLDKKEDDELYGWVLSYAAVLSEVVVNFKAATTQDK